MYLTAFDGGGTKTKCLIADLQGRIVAETTGGTSNHQICGQAETRRVIEQLFKQALYQAGLRPESIRLALLGLAGADLPEDFAMLDSLLTPVFPGIPLNILNDTWIIMRSGLQAAWGAVCICGTGANAGAVHPDGQRNILRSLGYNLGNYGGGGDIATEALHHAFRADEWTGPPTRLQQVLPELFEVSSMNALVGFFYPHTHLIVEEKQKKIPPLVFELASAGDRICQDILVRMGDILGQMTAGVIRKVKMEQMEVPVVLGGSIFNGSCPLLIDALVQALHRQVPGAFVRKPDIPPVAGAYLAALDELKIEDTPLIHEKIRQYNWK